MTQSLSGRVALITGAGRNIGRQMALTLAKQGAAVAVNVRSNDEQGMEVVEACRAEGGSSELITGDVSDREQVLAIFRQARESLGPVSILINNVGIRPHTPFLEITEEEWRWVLGAGLDGAFFCSQEALKEMVEIGWGRIINMSGRDGFAGRSNRAHGVTVKAGLHGLTKALAAEFGPRGITANTIVPGAIRTTRPKEWYPGFDYGKRADTIPVGRVGEVDEVAELALYLIRQDGFVNGTAVHINGGELLV